MEVLRIVRDGGGGARLIDRLGAGLRVRARWAVLLVFPVAFASCRERPDPTLFPDQVLRDSLGLGDEDRVHVVRIRAVGNRESPDPATLEIRPGDYVQFVTADHRVHVVAFESDRSNPAGGDFLRRTGQEAAPPLVTEGARFVVTFADAPPGRYPFRVVGNGDDGGGVIVVGEPKR